MKRRERTISVACLVPGGTGLSRTIDFNGRWGTPDDASLTSTRFASQEEQETCFHLIEEGCESTSFGFAQRGQAIVIMGSTPLHEAHHHSPARVEIFARAQEPLNHSAKYQERNSAKPAQRLGLDRRKIKRLSVDAYLGGKRVIVTGSYRSADPPGVRQANVCLSQ